MKQVEYTLLTMFVYVIAFSMLVIAKVIQSTAIWYGSILIPFIQALGWLLIALGFCGAFATMFISLDTFYNFNRGLKERRR
ncbi:MAG: hypothetical protein Q4B70_10160 [Lachnospiraceae bacterium]|nr:hypothetical protein [Lachnospiraceae bacterium]